jgi:hypothetical protein|tara:strand:+ start:1530 stop:1697 length:168 start_codon:yes stop_codon:yes gene_type:complete
MNNLDTLMNNSKELGRIIGSIKNLQLYEVHLSETTRDYFRSELDKILKSVDNIKL